LPALIDLYEEHAEHRDRFEIIAFHDAQAKSFAELDPKLEKIIERYWQGRPLPFPIFLDETGKTIEGYGIRAFPTTILIDPSGNLVKLPPEKTADEVLESKLPSVPFARRIPAALDHGVSFSVGPGLKLDKTFEYLARRARIDFDWDESARPRKDAEPEIMVAGNLTLRSWLDLILTPVGLTVVPDEKGLLITTRTAENGKLLEPGPRQREAERRVAKSLKRPVVLDLKGASWEALFEALDGQLDESFALDPIALRKGKLARDAVLNASSRGEPADQALAKLLGPLALTLRVQDEVVLIVPATE
jgi:hypothetical protein